MKKLLVSISLICLALIMPLLVGCDVDGIECVQDRCTDEVVYYTQEEVDAMFAELYAELEQNDIDNWDLILDTFYTKDEIDEGFEDIALWIEQHEQDYQVTYTQCNVEDMVADLFDILEDTSRESYPYTYVVDEFGDLLEFRDGIYSETITIQDFLELYCTIESID